MSLLEKLAQKRTVKNQEEAQLNVQEKKQSFEQLNGQSLALTEKKQRITELKASLRQHYGEGEQNLDSFKSQKEQLKGAYEENKDILAEEGVEDFEGMLAANADEPEVKNYRQAGGRAPAETEGAKISTGEAGKTGKLYKTVGGIKEIKEALNTEMPEAKLNFSAVTKKDADLSNREQSFNQVDEYLKSLDKEIAELNKEKEDAYLKTPEGASAALNNIVNPENIFRNQEPDRLNNFEIRNDVFKLSETTGIEPIKNLYTGALNKRLEGLAWSKKNNQEKDAINNYQDLEKLSQVNYNTQEIEAVNKNYQEVVKQIASILEKSPDKALEFGNYGLNSHRNKLYSKENGGSNEQALADAFIQHMSQLYVGKDLGALKQEMEECQKKLAYIKDTNSNRSTYTSEFYSPEYFQSELNKYSRFLEYLKTNTNENTDFLNYKDSLINKVKGQNGFADSKDKDLNKYNKVPLEMIKNRGGLDYALNNAQNENNTWEETKAKINSVSKAAVDFRFAQAGERYFSDNNREVLKNIDYERALMTGLQKTIDYLNNHTATHDPELSQRKVKIKIEMFGAKIHEADSEYAPIRETTQAARDKVNAYATEHIEAIDREISKLRSAGLVFGRAGKIEKLETKMNVFKEFKNDKPLKESDVTTLGISPEDILQMKELRAEKDAGDKKYRHYDDTRLRFFRSIDERKLEFPIKKEDVLNGQEMTFAELPVRLQARLDEVKAYTNNLPEPEKSISDERDRATKDIEDKHKIFDAAVAKNIDIIRELR